MARRGGTKGRAAPRGDGAAPRIGGDEGGGLEWERGKGQLGARVRGEWDGLGLRPIVPPSLGPCGRPLGHASLGQRPTSLIPPKN